MVWFGVVLQFKKQELAGLSEHAARQLLRKHAGLTDDLRLEPELQELECQILAVCAGLPLALGVMGGMMWQDDQPRQLHVSRTAKWKVGLRQQVAAVQQQLFLLHDMLHNVTRVKHQDIMQLGLQVLVRLSCKLWHLIK
jgi:hypothetical protein